MFWLDELGLDQLLVEPVLVRLLLLFGAGLVVEDGIEEGVRDVPLAGRSYLLDGAVLGAFVLLLLEFTRFALGLVEGVVVGVVVLVLLLLMSRLILLALGEIAGVVVVLEGLVPVPVPVDVPAPDGL